MAAQSSAVTVATEVLKCLPVAGTARERATVALEGLSMALRVLAGELSDPPQVDPDLLALRQAVDLLRTPPQPNPLNAMQENAMLRAMSVLAKTAEGFRAAYAAETLDANARGIIGSGLRTVLAIVEGHRP